MSRLIFLPILSLALATAGAARADCLKARPGRPLSVLFVGNSYTYFHNMPEIAEAIARANGVELSTRLVASGGATLHDHLDSGDALAAIRGGRWDYVLLQEQSGFGDTYLVDGRFRVRSTASWIADARTLAAAARAQGATPVLLAHWAMRDSAEDQPMIDHLYSRAVAAAGACLIRTGPARLAAERSLGRKALYIEDGSHPTPVASYLVAALVVRELTGRITSLPARVSGEAIEQDEGKRLGRTETLAELTGAQVRTIRSAIAGAETAAVAPVDTQPPEPSTPALPRPGGPVTASALVGRWSGPLKLYPVPATLTVTFHAAAGGLAADVRVQGDGGEARGVMDAPVTVSPRSLAFAFPKGPNGTTVQFRGVLTGRAGLAGVAGFESPAHDLGGVGTWRAARVEASAPSG